MRGVGRLRAAIAAAAVLVLAACSSGSPSAGSQSAGPQTSLPPVTSTPGALPSPEHVLVVLFENQNAPNVLGSADAPYLTSLARDGVTFTDAHGITHPSQPNYLALFSGSTQGVTDDSCPQSFDGPNLAGELIAAGHTFAGYSEDMPGAGYTGCKADGYRRKHNPWVDFPALPKEVNQPYSAFPKDFADLPTVAFVVPNLCNDMHDCDVKTGDRWARTHLDEYVRWARDHDSLLIVTFDEDDGSEANVIATFMAGPMVRSGTSDQRIDHYAVLRTIEDMYGLTPLGEAANRAPITGVWTSP